MENCSSPNIIEIHKKEEKIDSLMANATCDNREYQSEDSTGKKQRRVRTLNQRGDLVNNLDLFQVQFNVSINKKSETSEFEKGKPKSKQNLNTDNLMSIAQTARKVGIKRRLLSN
mmetsp:Transcript_9756/g.8595  ORF Transcript_9756/g.8595 Transcript_9756/m.8595 type:complete len:115 (-) Transcript_9756:3-347(-)